MASDPILDLDQILAPIADDNPVGNDPRLDSAQDSPYSEIREARKAARAAERNNMLDASSQEADEYWRRILDLGPQILQTQAKDLEVASWLSEALIRRYGFQGLRDGFELIGGLVEQYWDGLYPLPDEDGIETRVASLKGLNGEGVEGVLVPPIRNVEITEGSPPAPFSLWQYQQALDVDKAPDEETRQEKAAKLGFSVDDVERAVSESSDGFYLDLLDDIASARDRYRQIGSKLDELCGVAEAPAISNIVNALQECHGAVKHLTRHKLPEVDPASEDGGDTDEAGAPGESATASAQQPAGGPIATREDAFRKLTEISAFFRKTEPHSPISYMLERVVKWGDLSLEDLIRELIPDSSARDFYGSLTGVRTEDD
jgi:type VI secretion system protein ImpA